jgi:hypothetical protein
MSREIANPSDMLLKLGAACPGCSGGNLPTFKADAPAVSQRETYLESQPRASMVVQEMANRDILQLNHQLEVCLQEQLKHEHRLVSLRSTL